MFEVRSGNVWLREFVEGDDDFDVYYSWLRDYDTIRFIGRREYLLSINEEEVREYVRGLNKSPYDCFFKVFYNEMFAGTLKIGHINWELLTADMGIMIGNREIRGRGRAAAIMKTGMSYAFDKLGLRKLTGGCASENIPMQKCFEKCGFIKEGCERQSLFLEGKFQDHYLYGIMKEEFVKED